MNLNCIAYGFDVAASVLSWPSSLLIAPTSPKPIWTTKYIVAIHSSTLYTESSKLYAKVQDVECAERWQFAMRIVWIATIVLPILDALAWISRVVAKCDPGVSAGYEEAETRQKAGERVRKIQALGDSVREFAFVLRTFGCAKELEECTPAEELASIRNQRYVHICANFSQNQPKEVIRRIGELIIELLQSTYNITSDAQALSDIDREDDERLIANMARAFSTILQAANNDPSCDWMKGETNHALYPVWHFLTTRHDDFYALCEKTAAKG